MKLPKYTLLKCLTFYILGDRDEMSGKDEVKKEASKEEEPMDVDDVKSEDKKEPATVAASS